MTEENNTPNTEQTEDETPKEPAAGLYVFYDDNSAIQVGVSGDYTIGEAIFMLSAAKANLELLQFRVLRQQQTQNPQDSKSRIILPS
jgi:hypothetical protein